MGKLEPIRSYLRFTNVEPRHIRILPRLEMGDEYLLPCANSTNSSNNNDDNNGNGTKNQGGWTIRKSPKMYSIQISSSIQFRGYTQIHLDDRGESTNQSSFYDQTISPLAREFVVRRRNVCVLLHGAEGSGRQRTFLGEAFLANSRSSSRRSSQIFEEDDVSSLGCDGVSDVNHENEKESPTRRISTNSAPPKEVVFRNDVSVCCSRLGEEGAMLPTLEDEDGILPRMLAETFCLLKDRDASLCTVGRDIPKLISKNEQTSKCRLRPSCECRIDDSASNVSVEFYTKGNNEFNNFSDKEEEEGPISHSLRISCIEIIDDLASGECTINDLLEGYRTSLSSSSPQDDIYVDFYESEYSNLDVSTTHRISTENIRHDVYTGMVYVEKVVEMQCRSYTAVMECIAMAEESVTSKASRREEDILFRDKLYHTVYLLSLESRNEQSDQITLSHQMIFTKIDESMSDSASLALHSSYLSLNKMIGDIATFSGDTTRSSSSNPLTKLLTEAIGGECCTVAIGTVNAEDDGGSLPTLRLGEVMSWMYNTADRAVVVRPRREGGGRVDRKPRGEGEADHLQRAKRELTVEQQRGYQTDIPQPRQISPMESQDEDDELPPDTTTPIDGTKRLSQSSNVNSRRSSQSSRSRPRNIQPVDFQNDEAFAENTAQFDDPKRLSQSSNVNSRRSSQSSHSRPRNIRPVDFQNDIAFAENTTQPDDPKQLSQSSNVNSRRSSHSSYSRPRSIQPVNFQSDSAFAETVNDFDGPKRLSQSSIVNSRRSSQSSKVPSVSRITECIEHADSQELSPSRPSLQRNNSLQRNPTKTSVSEESSLIRPPSLGANSYNSFSLDMDDIPEQSRQSFASGALAYSDNPFVRRYAAALDKSLSSLAPSQDLSERKKSITSETSLPYDPVKDAKLFLSEIDAMRDQDEENVTDADCVIATSATSQLDWREISNEIEDDIDKTRTRMLQRMKQQSRSSHLDYTLDFAQGLSHQEKNMAEKQFPPEYVSVELSSHGSSERHQMAMDEMQNTHALAVADMQRALVSLQAERDELIREKIDNFHELQRAREDIGRLKAVYKTEGPHGVLSEPPQAKPCDFESSAVSASANQIENEPMQVFLRVRPLNKLEKHCRAGYSCINASSTETNCCLVKSPFDEEDTFEYKFDKVIHQYVTLSY